MKSINLNPQKDLRAGMFQGHFCHNPSPSRIRRPLTPQLIIVRWFWNHNERSPDVRLASHAHIHMNTWHSWQCAENVERRGLAWRLLMCVYVQYKLNSVVCLSVCVLVESQRGLRFSKHTFHGLSVSCIVSTWHSHGQISARKQSGAGLKGCKLCAWICVCAHECKHRHEL